VAYLAFVREGKPSGTAGAHWREWYFFLPWEDWRNGRPEVIGKYIEPALRKWAKAAPSIRSQQERLERIEISFGLDGAPWDQERVLDRYELIYEVDLAIEALRDQGTLAKAAIDASLGRPMSLDHRRILASALGRLRGKLKYRPVVFELLPATFTLFQLQRVVEALAGLRLHKQNFRRLVETCRMVEGTAQFDAQTGGRPAELFRFRREVLRERPAPGVGFPGIRHSG
jgi:hypothetical protein